MKFGRTVLLIRGNMAGDQGSSGSIIDIYTQKQGCIVHKQIEKRGDRIFLRASKKSIVDMLDL